MPILRFLIFSQKIIVLWLSFFGKIGKYYLWLKNDNRSKTEIINEK